MNSPPAPAVATMSGENLALDAHTVAAVATARLDTHEKICTERYTRIAGDTTEIKAAIQSLSSDLKGAVQRIHDRIDDEAENARSDNESLAQEVSATRDRIAGLKIWVLSSAATILLGIIGWFADHFFSSPKP